MIQASLTFAQTEQMLIRLSPATTTFTNCLNIEEKNFSKTLYWNLGGD